MMGEELEHNPLDMHFYSHCIAHWDEAADDDNVAIYTVIWHSMWRGIRRNLL